MSIAELCTACRTGDSQAGSTNRAGRTALHYACYTNSASVIPLFGQDRRCSPGILNTRDIAGDTAVMWAVCYGYLDCVKEMDKLEGTNFRTKNAAGDTLIDVARIKKKQVDVLEYLLLRSRKEDTLKDISAYNVAKYIISKGVVGVLEIPESLKSLVAKYVDR